MLATRSPLWTTISKLGCPMGGRREGGGGELCSVGCLSYGAMGGAMFCGLSYGGGGGGLCSVGCWWGWVIIAHRHHLLSMCIF